MRVLLADGRAQVRSAFHILLGQEAELILVSDVDDARNLPAAIDATQPDVVLLDWELPHLVGPRMLVTLRSLFPELQVIVLSCQLENKHVALISGADAFVSKIDPPDHLLELLRYKASELASQLKPEVSGVVSR